MTARNLASGPDAISKAGLTLLAALGSGSSGVRDAATPDHIAIISGRNGVSLSTGRYPATLVDALAARDLVGWSTGGGHPVRLGLTEVGRAFLRRHQAGPGDDRFRQQHGPWRMEEVEADAAGPTRVSVNTRENPLDWLSRRRDRDGQPLIDRTEHEAGERLRRDLTSGHILPGVTARWSAGASGGRFDPASATDATVAARQRVRRALDAVGRDFAGLLIDLCGFLKGLEDIERERRWPPRSGKVVVRLALRRLAEHYGLSSEATGRDTAGPLRSWQAAVGLSGEAQPAATTR